MLLYGEVTHPLPPPTPLYLFASLPFLFIPLSPPSPLPILRPITSPPSPSPRIEYHQFNILFHSLWGSIGMERCEGSVV